MKKPPVLRCGPMLNPRLVLLAVLVATVSLSGCGGGGGSSSTISESAPTASSFTVSTAEDTPTSSTLSASDADGDPLTFSIASQGTKGVVNITDPATGTFTYSPDPDESGTDAFTFTASDGEAESNIATVSVTIDPVNDPPVTTGGCGATPQAQTLAGTLSASDLETPADFLTYSLLDPNDGSPQGAGPITTAKGATVGVNVTTGAFTYQPGTTAGDRRGTDTFDYQVTDLDDGVSSATQTVVVDQAIMPLGDSITQGSVFDSGNNNFGDPDFRAGYRKPLYTLLDPDYGFDFVGSLSHGSAVLADFNHEGHGGWTAIEIAWGQTGFPTDGVQAWLNNTPADIILLHAGTNGLDPTTTPAIIVSDIEAILDEIDVWERSASGNPVTVILAQIIDQNPINDDVKPFNQQLASMANDRIANPSNPDNIVVIDQRSALIYPNDLSDQLHPTDNGYAKMAPVWFNALETVLDKCP